MELKTPEYFESLGFKVNQMLFDALNKNLNEILKEISLRWWRIDQIKSVFIDSESTLESLISIGATDSQSNFLEIIKSFNIIVADTPITNDEFLSFSLMFDFKFVNLFYKLQTSAYRGARRTALGDKY